MSYAMLSGLLGLVVVSMSVAWLVLKSNRAPADDRVTSSVLARINTEYRDHS